MNYRFLPLVALLATGCVSFVEAPRLSPELAERILVAPSPHFRAHLECPPSGTADVRACEAAVAEMKTLLAASPWFDSLEADPAEADLLLTLQPLERTPYWYSPGHSPAGLLLAVVLPLAWEVRSGYRLTAVVPGSGITAEVDTRREDRAVSWSLAPILNLLSRDRALVPSSERELARIHAQLLPLVEAGPGS